MSANITKLTMAASTVVLAFAFGAPVCAAPNEDAAVELLKRNDCTKCHDVKKAKKGPAYAKVATKYKGKADAEQKLLENVTKEPMVKLEDGTQQKHKKIDTADAKELKNLFEYILTRQ